MELRIPTNLTSGVQLSYEGYDISIVPQGGSMLTLPRKVDNSVLYDNYFGAGTKLIYTPTLDGVKEDSCGYFNNSPSSEDGLQVAANCYGYVMRLYYLDRGYVTYGYYQQPGEFANKSGGYTINCNIGNYSRTETINDYGSLRDLQDDVIYPAPEAARIEWFYQLMKADGARLGFTISKCASSDIYSAPSMTGKRLSALVVSSSNYHFYMQHEDGTWSHKDGHGATTKKCINHGYDLTNANITTHACEGSLAPSATTVAFFYITKTIADTCHGDGCYDREVSCTPLG